MGEPDNTQSSHRGDPVLPSLWDQSLSSLENHHGLPILQVRTPLRKLGGPIAWGGSKERGLVPWGGPGQYSRLAWSRTVSLHSPPLRDGHLSIWSYSSVGPTTWGPAPENGHSSPGVVQSRVAA
jgi:hypothetical protein